MKRIQKAFGLMALAAGLLAAGCFAEKKSGGTAAGTTAGESRGGENRLDASRVFGAPVTIENLTVWPIIAEIIREIGDFVTLGEAQEKGVAVVKEVGASGAPAVQGSSSVLRPPLPRAQAVQVAAPNDAPELASSGAAQVNTLMIENRGDTPILVCGGTVVKGGKQDRQIAQDFVIAPKTSTPVDAFCVEQGRWTELREGLATASLFRCANTVALKEVRASAQYARSQDAVWRNVALSNEAAGNAPATSTLLATLEETDKEAVARRGELEKAVRVHFESLRAKGKRPVGFAYAVNGKPVTVRTFAHPKVFDGQFEPFMKAMCIEAELSRRTKEGAAPAPASLKDVIELVQGINQENEEVSPTRAANKNGVRKSARGGNSNCYVEAPRGDQLVPLTQDWTSK